MMEVLQNRRFRAIWYVVNVAELTRWMELLVSSLLVYWLTDSPLMLGLVLAFENLPRPVLSPFTGIIADRFDRKRIWFSALAIKLVAAVILLVLLGFGLIAAWHIFASMFAQGVSRALEDPARRTAVFDIVGERRVVNALSIDSISMTMGRMVGPFAGGFLVEHVGYYWPYFAGYVWAYTVVVVMHSAAVLMAMRVSIPSVEREWRVEPIWNSLGAVVRAALSHRQLVGMLFITTIINGLAFPARQFVPAIGRDHLHVGETLVGVLAAGEAIGQLAMAGVLASVGSVRHHGRIFAIGAFVVMITSTIFVWSPWYSATFLVLIVSGLGLSCFGTMQSAITMRSAPPEMRGRMVGLMSLCIGIGTPPGVLLMGWLGELIGVQRSVSILALACIAVSLPALFLTPLITRPSPPPPQSLAARRV
jgi:MFS family permease